MIGASDDAAQVALSDLTVLLAACRRVSGLLDVALVAQRAAAEARNLTATELSAIAVVDEPRLLVMRGTSGVRSPEIAQLKIPRGSGLGGRILLERRPISVTDYANTNGISRDFVDVVADEEGIRALLGVPIEYENQVYGILYSGLRSVGSVGRRGETMLLEFARSLGPQLHAARQAELARHLSVLQERQRIALELHDTVGQLLFGIGVATRRARANAADPPPALLADLEDVEARASHAASQLRVALRALSPGTPQEGLATSIRMDVAAFTDRTGIPAHSVVVGDPFDVTGTTCAALLAVVREGLHNVEKHACATSVIVTLYYAQNAIGVVIQDDGVGLPTEFGIQPMPLGGHHLGLASLVERVQRVSGTLVAIPNEDGGVTLRANIPVGLTAL